MRNYVTLILALAQFPASGFARITGIGVSIEKAAGAPAPENPAGYAFAIWFVLFSLSVAYAVRALTKSGHRLADAIGWSAAIAFAGSSAWMIVVQVAGDGWVPVCLIMTMFAASCYAFMQCIRNSGIVIPYDRYATFPLWGMLTGWLTVAMFLNLTSVIQDNFGTFGLNATAYAFLSLAPALLVALILLRISRGSIWYAGVIVWALAAVIVNNMFIVPNMIIACAASAGIAIVIVATFFARRKNASTLRVV